MDRNLLLYLPRLAVLVRIEADRPGAWFSNPMETPFVLTSFGGSYSKKSIFASRQPGHVKHLLSGLYDLLKFNFHSLLVGVNIRAGTYLRRFPNILLLGALENISGV